MLHNSKRKNGYEVTIMIWVWILAAVIISWFFCKKGINWYHYIWLFLPIEMYGIDFIGATIKPYMIFGCFIILANLVKYKTIKINFAIMCVAFSLMISDCLNGFIMASVMQHIMFMFVLMIGYCYKNCQSNGIEFEGIGSAALSTTIGYGTVFTVAWIIFNLGYSIEGLYTYERLDAGVVLKQLSFGGIFSSRLRGFCIDPNSVITTLIPGAAYAMVNIIYKKKDVMKSFFGIITYLVVVFSSGSRMALLCSIVMFMLFAFIGYKRSSNKRWIIAFGIIAVIGFLVIILTNINTIAFELEKIWLELFGGRASLGSEYGRITIWKTNLMYLIDNNKLWFGVGQNQIYLLTEIGLACHNTWLEWICGTGLFVGIIIDTWFISAPLCFRKKTMKKITSLDTLPIILSYITVFLCVSTVDNITNSVLLFFMLILRYGVINDNYMAERLV